MSEYLVDIQHEKLSFFTQNGICDVLSKDKSGKSEMSNSRVA